MGVSRRRKRIIWRWVFTCGLFLELVLIAVASVSLYRGPHRFPVLQSVAFVAIGVWIYIAYLKQRHIDISKSVVDEKVKTHALVEYIRDGVIILDGRCRVLLINGVASRMTGLAELDVLGNDIRSLLDDSAARAVAAGQDGELAASVTTTGKRVKLSIRNLGAPEDDEAHRLVCVEAVDSEAGVSEAAAAAGADTCASRAVGEVLRLLAGETARRLEDAEGEERKRLAGLVLRGLLLGAAQDGADAAALVRTRGLAEALEKGSESVTSLLHEVTDAVSGAARSLAVTLEVPSEDFEATTNVDARLLRLAFSETVYNAVLAAAGGGRVAIRVGGMGPSVGLSVVDSGIPVPAEAVDSVFDDPYTGVPSRDGKRVRSDGTGYFLSRGIIEAHGGTLVAEGAEDGGLRILMTVPE